MTRSSLTRFFAEKAAREQAAAEENPTSTDATDALTAGADTLPVQADDAEPESFDTEVKEELLLLRNTMTWNGLLPKQKKRHSSLQKRQKQTVKKQKLLRSNRLITP